MSKTMEDLQAAFAGESQANRRYLAYADAADKEGQPQLARLYRAAAAAETVHAHSHLRSMGQVGSLEDNLKAAISGENHEVTCMYPEFMQDAEAEGNTQALKSFKRAWEVEKVHEGMFREALADLLEGKQSEDFDYYICPVCGYTHRRTAPERCPVCGVPGEKFFAVH